MFFIVEPAVKIVVCNPSFFDSLIDTRRQPVGKDPAEHRLDLQHFFLGRFEGIGLQEFELQRG